MKQIKSITIITLMHLINLILMIFSNVSLEHKIIKLLLRSISHFSFFISDGNFSFLDTYSSTGESTTDNAFNPAAAAASMRDSEMPPELITDKPIIHKLYCTLEDL